MNDEKKTATQIFAEDLYDYIWSKQTIFKTGLNEKFIERYSLKFSELNTRSPCTESIGRAVRVSQYLLREYFRKFFDFTFIIHDFKDEVKLALSRWLRKRNNVFVKVIDCLAIIAEAFLYCDRYKSFNFNLEEASDWFVEWFEELLAPEFFRCGGFKQLYNLVGTWYEPLFSDVESVMDQHKSYMYKFTEHDCEVIYALRKSFVAFPVAEYLFCAKCGVESDRKFKQRIVYVRPQSSIQNTMRTKIIESEVQEHISNEVESTVARDNYKSNEVYSDLVKQALQTESTPLYKQFIAENDTIDGISSDRNFDFSAVYPEVSNNTLSDVGNLPPQSDSRATDFNESINKSSPFKSATSKLKSLNKDLGSLKKNVQTPEFDTLVDDIDQNLDNSGQNMSLEDTISINIKYSPSYKLSDKSAEALEIAEANYLAESKEGSDVSIPNETFIPKKMGALTSQINQLNETNSFIKQVEEDFRSESGLTSEDPTSNESVDEINQKLLELYLNKKYKTNCKPEYSFFDLKYDNSVKNMLSEIELCAGNEETTEEGTMLNLCKPEPVDCSFFKCHDLCFQMVGKSRNRKKSSKGESNKFIFQYSPKSPKNNKRRKSQIRTIKL